MQFAEGQDYHCHTLLQPTAGAVVVADQGFTVCAIQAAWLLHPVLKLSWFQPLQLALADPKDAYSVHTKAVLCAASLQGLRVSVQRHGVQSGMNKPCSLCRQWPYHTPVLPDCPLSEEEEEGGTCVVFRYVYGHALQPLNTLVSLAVHLMCTSNSSCMCTLHKSIGYLVHATNVMHI